MFSSSLSSQYLVNNSKLKNVQVDNFTKKGCLIWVEKKFNIMGSSTKPITKLESSSTSTYEISDTNILLNDSSNLLQTASSSTPLVEALKSCAAQDVACFHFPGHNRGKAAPRLLSQLTTINPFIHDLPELPELDDLFYPHGVILDAQNQAAKLFGASNTWFLVGGTTCGIQASIMATCSPGQTLVLPRNSHISAISGLVLSGASPKYIIPEYNSNWDIAGGITKSQVENALNELDSTGKKAGAVLIVSPTYHGICSNLKEIIALCHARDVPCIVDEAHGAHFGFHDMFPSTALEQGADLAVQSTHKVLSSLTQSSMLHLSGDMVDKDEVSKCLQMLQSSSPSYLLLASLDAARAQLSENPSTIFNKAVKLATMARLEISKLPRALLLDASKFMSDFPSIDPLRITIGVSQLGISGYEADDILCQERKVVAELAGSRSLTFAFNLGTCSNDVKRLIASIKYLSNRYFKTNDLGSDMQNKVDDYEPFNDFAYKLSPRDAFFAKKRKVNIDESIGEICGELISSYPPGIPVLIPGEVVTEKALSYLIDVKGMGASISGAADHQLSSMRVCDV